LPLTSTLLAHLALKQLMPGRGSFIRWNKAILKKTGLIRLEYSSLVG
jgi:uncharacterized membrane protein YobD (UPF0266 family)